jgi:hypothetical protein
VTTITLTQLAERIARHPSSTTAQIARAKRLAETDGLADTPMPEPAADADPGEAVTAGFKAAIAAVIGQVLAGDLDAKAALKTVKRLLAAHADAIAADDESEGGEDDETPAGAEGRARDPKQMLREAIAACKRAGWKGYDADDLEIVCEGRTAAGMDARVRRLMGAARFDGAGEERPTSRGRPGFAGRNPARPPAEPPKDVKQFMESIR